MKTTKKWLLGLCAGFISIAAHAIPVTSTLTSAPATLTTNPQTISFTLDLSGLDFAANVYSVNSASLVLGFGFTGQNSNQIGNAMGNTISLAFASGAASGTASTLNGQAITIDPAWFDFSTGLFNVGISRSNSSGTISLSGASFSLALAAEPRVIEQDPPNNPGNEHAVPEPGTLALLGLGLFGLAILRRRPNAGALAA